MPAYNARTSPSLTSLPILGNKGFIEPLCNSCKARDCENPIEYKDVVITGVTKKMRVWVSGGRVSYVLVCDGYCE